MLPAWPHPSRPRRLTRNNRPTGAWGSRADSDPQAQIESAESLFTRSSTQRAAKEAARARRDAARAAPEDAPDAATERPAGQAVLPNKKKGPSLKARAVDYLSRREHSRLELGRKLARFADEGDDVNAVMDGLEKEGWLSAERFTQSLVHRRSPKQGMARVVQELRQHGVGGQELAEVKATLAASELPRAREVWQRRFGELPTDAQARGKQTRFLMSRGFSLDVIRKVLAGAPADDDHD